MIKEFSPGRKDSESSLFLFSAAVLSLSLILDKRFYSLPFIVLATIVDIEQPVRGFAQK
jgi:hypothetical protein